MISFIPHVTRTPIRTLVHVTYEHSHAMQSVYDNRCGCRTLSWGIPTHLLMHVASAASSSENACLMKFEWMKTVMNEFTFYFIYILVWIVDDSSMTAKNSVVFVIPIHWLWAGSHLYPTQQPCGFCSVLLKENEMVHEIYLSKRDTYKLFDKCWLVEPVI